MNVSTRRFILRVEHHTASLLDRDGPMRWRAFAAAVVPSESEIAQMNERDFNRAMSKIYYGEG